MRKAQAPLLFAYIPTLAKPRKKIDGYNSRAVIAIVVALAIDPGFWLDVDLVCLNETCQSITNLLVLYHRISWIHLSLDSYHLSDLSAFICLSKIYEVDH